MQCEYLLLLCHMVNHVSYHIIVLWLSLEGLLFQSLQKISAIFRLTFVAPATCS